MAKISLASCFLFWKRVIVKLIQLKILFHRPTANLLSCFDLLARYCFAVLGVGDFVLYYIWDDSNKSENLTVALVNFLLPLIVNRLINLGLQLRNIRLLHKMHHLVYLFLSYKITVICKSKVFSLDCLSSMSLMLLCRPSFSRLRCYKSSFCFVDSFFLFFCLFFWRIYCMIIKRIDFKHVYIYIFHFRKFLSFQVSHPVHNLMKDHFWQSLIWVIYFVKDSKLEAMPQLKKLFLSDDAVHYWYLWFV